jgi:arylsulfatase A-like enzyme
VGKRPNILFLFPDQLRADFLGCYGAEFARTPAIDALAAEGIVYERAASMHPVCIPARAALLTGCNAVSTGVLTNNEWLRPDHEACGQPSWPSLLARAGYHTEAIGKMHFIPWDDAEGFSHRVISEDKRHIHIEDDYAAYLAGHGLRKRRGWEEEGYTESLMASISSIPAEHQVDVWCGRQAVEFLDSYDGDKPFACMVAFPGPHDPYDPPADWAARFDPADMPPALPRNADTDRFRDELIRQHRSGSSQVDLANFPEATKQRVRAHYSALIAMIDEQVGAILAALARRPDADNTIVVLAADHGDFVGDHDFLGKNLFFDAAMHVPMILRLPHGPKGQRSGELVTVTDLFATFLAIAGIDNKTGRDSCALPAVAAEGAPRRRHALGAVGNGVCIQDSRHRLARYDNGLATLYALERPAAEQVNLVDAPEAQDIRAELDAAMAAELLKATRVGHRDKRYPYVTMTAGHPAHRHGWRRPYPWDGAV